MSGNITKALDHLTDIAAIGGLTYLAAVGAIDPSATSAGVVGAITSIALGQRYMKGRLGGK